MSLAFFNSLTRTREAFTPLEPGRVKLYVCGPTVYDHSHIGHARAVVVFDVLVRFLRSAGFEVTYVRNFTDVDDKIIRRSQEEGLDYLELADKYIRSFHEDMDALGALRPDAEPRATQYIDQMLKDVQALMDSGHAYGVDGDVYYDVTSLPDYGVLSGRSLEDMQAGARVEVDERKRNPYDFALWKASKPGEPSWPTPWGVPGRPGWHTECSAMSFKLLGREFDIHGGGHDLVFPHHENEIAQAHALGRGFARLWLHNGFVQINHEKMSKSLGNFFTIKQVLETFHPEAVRLFLVSKHYRSPIDFSDEALRETTLSLERVYRSLQRAAEAGAELSETADRNAAGDFLTAFDEAMSDDLNTAKALGHLFEAVRELNRLLEEGVSGRESRLSGLAGSIRYMGGILGILGSAPDDFFEALNRMNLADSEWSPERIEAMIQARADARSAKDWKEADRIRDELKANGIILEDAGGKTTWRTA